MLFMPATAVDRDGNRIGQGGGYYDVFQSHLAAAGRDIPRAAVVFDDELLPAGSIPAEPFDRPVPDGPDTVRLPAASPWRIEPAPEASRREMIELALRPCDC